MSVLLQKIPSVTSVLRGSIGSHSLRDKKDFDERLKHRIASAIIAEAARCSSQKIDIRTGFIAVVKSSLRSLEPNGFALDELRKEGYNVSIQLYKDWDCGCDYGCKGGHLEYDCVEYVITIPQETK